MSGEGSWKSNQEYREALQEFPETHDSEALARKGAAETSDEEDEELEVDAELELDDDDDLDDEDLGMDDELLDGEEESAAKGGDDDEEEW
jgi:hypothetical protein